MSKPLRERTRIKIRNRITQKMRENARQYGERVILDKRNRFKKVKPNVQEFFEDDYGLPSSGNSDDDEY